LASDDGQLVYKTRDEIRADILRVIVNGASRRGYDNVNVAEGSDYYRIADAVAMELENGYGVAVSAFDRFMPDTTTGDDLDQWLQNVRLARRGAGPSTGNIEFDTTASTLVATGQELLDPSGAKFVVVTGGTYADGDLIAVQSEASGINTNLDGGTVLRWVSPPAFAANTAPLDSNGATGGVDEEDDDTARQRLLERLGTPPSAGNWSHIASLAESGSVAVQKAFVYPACNGPATVHVAVAGYAAGADSRTRVVNAANIAAAKSAIEAEIPEGIELTVTTVADSAADVSIELELPGAQDADFGTGGGWIDATPFPQVHGSATNNYVYVSTYVSTTSFTLANLLQAPSVGDTICYVDDSDFTLYTAEILTAGALGGGGPYTCAITIDKPFLNIAVNDYVFPAAENTQAYVTALLDAFAALGPGEKTSEAGLLPRAYRRPRVFNSWSYKLDGRILEAVESAGTEVYDAQWGYQNGGTTSPALPSTIADPPKIFTPRRIAFYPI